MSERERERDRERESERQVVFVSGGIVCERERVSMSVFSRK